MYILYIFDNFCHIEMQVLYNCWRILYPIDVIYYITRGQDFNDIDYN